MAVRKKKSAGNDFLLIDALKDLCAEKEISQDTLFDAIESALVFACKKTANADKRVIVELDRDKGFFHVYEVQEIVEEVKNPTREISLEDARAIDARYEIGDVYRKEVPPNKFGRIAAQAAKQFVMQKIREAERGVVYDEFTNRDNDVVTGTVTRIEDGNVIVDIGKTEAILVPIEQIYTDRFQIGDRVRAYVAEVRKMGKGPQVYLSRTHPGLLRRLFELEVPEIQEGIITIKAVAREAGNRSKIAVTSQDPNIDAVGACLGEHGVRAAAISKELGNEKIDIVKWDEDPAVFIANALSPSKVMKVAVNEYDKMSRVVVPNNQLSLAIGKEGQNARLAAKLTGWKIDIKSKAQAKDEVLPEDMRQVKVGETLKKKKKKKKSPEELQQEQKAPKEKPQKQKQKAEKKPAPTPPPQQDTEEFSAYLLAGFDDFSDSDFPEEETSAPSQEKTPPPKNTTTPQPNTKEISTDLFDSFDDFAEPDFSDEETSAPKQEKSAQANDGLAGFDDFPNEEKSAPKQEKSAQANDGLAGFEDFPEEEKSAQANDGLAGFDNPPEEKNSAPKQETSAQANDGLAGFDNSPAEEKSAPKQEKLPAPKQKKTPEPKTKKSPAPETDLLAGFDDFDDMDLPDFDDSSDKK